MLARASAPRPAGAHPSGPEGKERPRNKIGASEEPGIYRKMGNKVVPKPLSTICTQSREAFCLEAFGHPPIGEVTGCKRVVPQTVPALQKQGRASALFHGASAVPQKPNLLVRDAGDSFEPHPCGSAMRNRYHRVRRLPEFYYGLRPCSVMQFEYAYHGMALELYSFALWKPAVEHLRVTAARTASASVMLRLPRIG